MSDYPKLAAEMGDRYLAALAARQESFLRYAAAARKLAPRPVLPSAATAIAATQQLNAAQFEFASRLLDQQKQFFDVLLSQRPHATKLAPKTSPAANRGKTVKKAASRKASPKTSAKPTSGKKRAAAKSGPALA